MKKSDREFIELMFAVCGDRLVASDSVSDALVRGAEAMYDHLTHWRPMRDAPKDGQWIEVVHEGVGVFPRQWDPVISALALKRMGDLISATMDLLNMSQICEEQGMEFPDLVTLLSEESNL